MAFPLFSIAADPIPFSPGLPLGFQGPFLRHAVSDYHTPAIGAVTRQMMAEEYFALYFYTIHPVKNTTAQVGAMDGLQSFHVIEGRAAPNVDNPFKLITPFV